MADVKGIRAGRAYVELGAVDAELRKALDAAAARLRAFGQSLVAIGTKLAGLGAAAVAGLGLAVKQFADTGSELERMAQRTGVSVESLSALRLGALQVGSELSAIEGALQAVSRTMAEAAQGADGANDKLMVLRLTFADLAGLNAEDRFMAIADQIARISDPALRAARAMEMFGSTALLPFLRDGRNGLRGLLAEATRLGIVLDSQTTKGAQQFSASLSGLRLSLEAVAIQVGAALAPALRGLMDAIAPVVRMTVEWVKANQEIVVVAGLSATALVGLGSALITAGLSMQVLSAATKGLALVVSVPLKAALLGVAAVAGLVKVVFLGLTLVVGIAKAVFLGLSAAAGVVQLALAGIAAAGIALKAVFVALSAVTVAMAKITAAATVASTAVTSIALAAKAVVLSLATGGLNILFGLVALVPAILVISAALSTISSTIKTMDVGANVVGDIRTSFASLWQSISVDGGSAWSILASTATSAFHSIVRTATTAWGSISDALKQGNLTLAFQIATTGILIEWEKLKYSMILAWDAMKPAVISTAQSIALALSDAWAAIQTGWMDLVEFMRKEWGTLVEEIKEGARISIGILRIIAGTIGSNRAQAVAGIVDLLDLGGKTPAQKAKEEEDRQAKDKQRREDIEAGRKGRAEAIKQLAGQALAAGPKPEDQARKTQEELNALYKQFADLREQARPLKIFGPPKPQQPGDDLLDANRRTDVSGTFSARLAGQIGSRTAVDRIAASTGKAAGHLERMEELIRKQQAGNAVVF